MDRKEKEQIDKETDEERNREYYEPLDSAFLDFVKNNETNLKKEFILLNLKKEFILLNEEEYLEFCKDEFRRT